MDRSLVILVLVAGCGPPSTPAGDGTIIGSTSVAIDTRSTATRVGEAPVGDFIADTLLAATRARGGDATVALVNSGAIRGGRTTRDAVPVDIDAKLGRVYGPGALTDHDVEGWIPFRDDHIIITVTAAVGSRSTVLSPYPTRWTIRPPAACTFAPAACRARTRLTRATSRPSDAVTVIGPVSSGPWHDPRRTVTDAASSAATAC